MTLEEERHYLAAEIRRFRAETRQLYEELNQRQPQSFSEQEDRSPHIARIKRYREFHEAPLLERLVRCMAAESRDNYCILNPVTRAHREAAEKLIDDTEDNTGDAERS